MGAAGKGERSRVPLNPRAGRFVPLFCSSCASPSSSPLFLGRFSGTLCVLAPGRLTPPPPPSAARRRAPQLQGSSQPCPPSLPRSHHTNPPPSPFPPRPTQRLSPGTPLLGRIHAIYPLHLVLALPSQLYAHVPLTSLSPALTARLSAAASSSSSSSHGGEEEDEEKEDDVPPLSSLFQIGSWHPTVVTRLYAPGESSPPALEGWKPRDAGERECRRVECSLEPGAVNGEVGRGDVEAGFVSSSPLSLPFAFLLGCSCPPLPPLPHPSCFPLHCPSPPRSPSRFPPPSLPLV